MPPRKSMWSKNGVMARLKHSFVASRENRFHPHLLRKNVVIAALVLIAFVEVGVLTQEFISFKHADYLASVLPGVVTDLTNNARASDNLALLTPDPVLAKAAQAKADDMAAKGYFAHVSPDGTLPWHWFQAAGYDYEYAGENLAVNFDDSTQLVNAWLASPAHRANILGSHFTSEGIGISQGSYEGKSTIFVVQFFAKPAIAAAKAAAATPPAKAAAAPAKVTPAPAKAVTTPLATVPATQPVETAAPTAAQPPAVLGVETAAPAVSATFDNLATSPLSTAAYVFGILGFFFLLALVLGLIFHVSLPRFDALVGGLAVLVFVLAFALVNHGFFAKISLPANTENATVYKALTQ